MADPAAARQRWAVVGVGQCLRGDDAAGLETVRRLRGITGERDDLLVIEAGPVPENFTGPLRRFRPQTVVLVDAAQMGAPPGTLRRLDWRDTGGYRGSSHTIPLATVAGFLEHETGCEVRLLGIQPEDTALDAALTPAAERGVDQAVELLRQWLAQD